MANTSTMRDFFLQSGHYFFIASHVVIILFILFGWLHRSLRRLHLVVIILTFLSWFVVGIWYGFGYCFWTDWHWQIRRALGHHNLPASFVKYAADTITGKNFESRLIEVTTLLCLLAAAFGSIYVNLRDRRSKQANRI